MIVYIVWLYEMILFIMLDEDFSWTIERYNESLYDEAQEDNLNTSRYASSLYVRISRMCGMNILVIR